MPHLTRQDERCIRRLEDLTAEAVDALKDEFYYRRKPPLPQVVCYTASMRMSDEPEFRSLLRKSKGVTERDTVYYNLDFLVPWHLEESLLVVGEETGHYLHSRINPLVDECLGNTCKKHQRELWREACSLSEFIGFWAGCLFAQRRGNYNPRAGLKNYKPWMNNDEEHYWGYYVAACLLRKRTPLRLRDFVKLQTWKSVERRYRPYLKFMPDFTRWPPRKQLL